MKLINIVIVSSFLLNLNTLVFAKEVDNFLDNKNGKELNFFINKALDYNLAINQQQIEASKANLEQVKVFKNPNLQLEGGSSSFFEKKNDYQTNFSYSQPLDLFNKRGSSIYVAELEIELSKNAYEITKQELLYQIKNKYLMVLFEAKYLETVESILDSNKQIFEIVKNKYKVGALSKYDYNLLQIENQRYYAEYLLAKNRLKTNFLELNKVAGLKEELKLSGNFISKKLPLQDLSFLSLYEKAKKNNPLLKKNELFETFYNAKAQELLANVFPTINLTGKYQRQLISIQNLSNTDNALLLNLSFELPVFNRNQGSINENYSTSESYKLSQTIFANNMEKDIKINFEKIKNYSELASLYESEILKYTNENFEIIKKMYELGERDLNIVLMEQKKTFQLQNEYLQIQKDLNLSIIELEKLIGANFYE